jgi:hypothetical protein
MEYALPSRQKFNTETSKNKWGFKR